MAFFFWFFFGSLLLTVPYFQVLVPQHFRFTFFFILSFAVVTVFWPMYNTNLYTFTICYGDSIWHPFSGDLFPLWGTINVNNVYYPSLWPFVLIPFVFLFPMPNRFCFKTFHLYSYNTFYYFVSFYQYDLFKNFYKRQCAWIEELYYFKTLRTLVGYSRFQ